MSSALEVLGISPTEDMDMVAQIKNEVRKICTRENICGHITANEAEAEKQANIANMIDLDAEKLKVCHIYYTFRHLILNFHFTNSQVHSVRMLD